MMKASTIFLIFIVSLFITACGKTENTPPRREPPFSMFEKEKVIPCDPASPRADMEIQYLKKNYSGVIKYQNDSLNQMEKAMVAIAQIKLGQTVKALMLYPQLQLQIIDVNRPVECWDYKKLKQVESCYEWIVLYHFAKNQQPQLSERCINSLHIDYAVATLSNIDILEAEIYVDLAILGDRKILLSPQMMQEVDSLAKIYPLWEVPLLLQAFRYKKLEWYGKSVESFWLAMEKGAEKDLVYGQILDCYSSYTGKKDSLYKDMGEWKSVVSEVPAFEGQSIPDSIKKYKRLAPRNGIK